MYREFVSGLFSAQSGSTNQSDAVACTNLARKNVSETDSFRDRSFYFAYGNGACGVDVQSLESLSKRDKSQSQVWTECDRGLGRNEIRRNGAGIT